MITYATSPRICGLFSWSRGYIVIIHGGGAAPVAQTPDTDLNENARREYGINESRLLIAKMRNGQTVPKATHEESMLLILEVLSDLQLHKQPTRGRGLLE